MFTISGSGILTMRRPLLSVHGEKLNKENPQEMIYSDIFLLALAAPILFPSRTIIPHLDVCARLQNLPKGESGLRVQIIR